MSILFSILLWFTPCPSEYIVFKNCTERNDFAVQIYQDNVLVAYKTLKPKQMVSFPLCNNQEYWIATKRITQFGEFNPMQCKATGYGDINQKIFVKVKNKFIYNLNVRDQV